jgi:hypothetical protein
MILDNKIKIKITLKNISHYREFYPSINLKDLIDVDCSHLQNNSNLKINVQCDICNEKRYIKYQAYYKNIKSCKKYPIYTCDKCSHIKIKEFNKGKYGVEYYSQTKEYTKKFKETMVSRYGVEYSQQSDELRKKSKNTNLEKIGIENPFMNNDKIKSIFKEKYGVDHPSKVPEFKEKTKNTMLKKYGYKSSLKSPFIREKIKLTMIQKYGNIIPMQNDIIRSNLKISKDLRYIKYEGNYVSSFNCEKGHIFLIDSVNYHNRIRLKIDSICTVCNPLNKNISIKEKDLLEFIKSVYSNFIISSYRDGLEIDIYLPDLKIGFEFNGLYWHSNEQKENNYHLKKTEYFQNKGIRIIHIWEDDWDNKRKIIESQIKNWINLYDKKIFARKCEVRKLNDIKIAKNFLNNNHIQGYVNSSIKLGLYYNDELVSLMTFDQFEGRKKMEDGGWNLSRFCNKLGLTVIGGASKLFNKFIEDNKPKRIISYADKDWSIGNLYIIMGFKKVGDIRYDYKYIVDNKRVHKSRYRKSRLNTNLTESEYMREKNIPKIYDCGKIKFEKSL